jgi:hypothetical protein
MTKKEIKNIRILKLVNGEEIIANEYRQDDSQPILKFKDPVKIIFKELKDKIKISFKIWSPYSPQLFVDDMFLKTESVIAISTVDNEILNAYKKYLKKRIKKNIEIVQIEEIKTNKLDILDIID